MLEIHSSQVNDHDCHKAEASYLTNQTGGQGTGWLTMNRELLGRTMKSWSVAVSVHWLDLPIKLVVDGVRASASGIESPRSISLPSLHWVVRRPAVTSSISWLISVASAEPSSLPRLADSATLAHTRMSATDLRLPFCAMMLALIHGRRPRRITQRRISSSKWGTRFASFCICEM